MTVVDFRSGGFDGVRRDDARDYGFYQQAPEAEYDDDGWDDARFATQSPDVPLTQRDSLVGRVARLGHYLGAILSVFLMLGLGVWGYRLVTVDVSGIPVIRALEGEARTAPDNPGGELSDRTGLAVNQVAGGVTARPADRVAIAPQATGLDAQDVAMGQLGATAQPGVAAEEEAVPADEAPVIAMTDAQVTARIAEEKKAAEAAALAAAEVEASATPGLPGVEAPVNEAVTDLAGVQTQETAISTALNEAAQEGANRPAPRPQRIAAAAATVPAAAPVEAAEVAVVEDVPTAKAEVAKVTQAEADPVHVSSGAALVQIGAFDSDSIAQSEFARVSGRYGDLFAGKSPVVVKHQAGGRTFWRLRVAGFENRDAARKFCASLIAAGTDCIPATSK